MTVLWDSLMLEDNVETNEKPAKPAKVKKVKPVLDYSFVIKDGNEFVTFKKGGILSNYIIASLRTVAGSQHTNSYGSFFPVGFLAGFNDLILEYCETQGWDLEHIKDFTSYQKAITKYSSKLKEEFENRIKNNSVEFNDVKRILVKGSEIVIDGNPRIGGVVDCVKFVPGGFFRPNSWGVELNVIHNLSGEITEDSYTYSIYEWKGTQKVEKIGFKFKNETSTDDLEKRGAIFSKFCNRPSYVKYSGNVTNSNWRGTDTFRADGRLMIDPKSMRTLQPDRYSQEMSQHGFGNDNDYEQSVAKNNFTLKPEDYWRVYPYSLGFSFRCKKWGTLTLDTVSDIEWRSEAFESLVLPSSDKRIVKALVENAGDSFTDIIDEKGGGTIFLLFGPPGEGKTLTAETIAELLKKPLYSVTVGELGTKPSELEASLRVILELATSWNAVLLLDEADIFLEARDTKDIVRNAMVGVFLRLLEYHQGTLFLTTNRVKNIDTAFYSRISIPLRFAAGDHNKRYKIWSNLLKAANIEKHFTHDQIYALSERNTNGRQIKNSIRIGQTLAKSENTNITLKHIEEVLDLADNFEKSLKLS